MMPYEKSKASIFKTKGFIRLTLIKSGVVVKKSFKDWKTFFIQLPMKKIDPFKSNE
jgi:hypothetical protein